MNILFVQKVKALVGSEKYFLELLPALEAQGHKTSFICIYSKVDKEKTQAFIDAMQALNLELHVLEISSEKAILKCVRFIRKVYKSGHFDLIHSHLIHADLWCALLKKFNRVSCPIVSTKHGYDEAYISVHGFSAKELKPNRYFRICKYAEKYIDRSFAVSEGLRQLFIEGGICTTDKITTIHHGFNLPALGDEKNPKYRKSAHQLVILGRIIPFKGHQLLLEALPQVKKVFPEFNLQIIGHGDPELIKDLKTFISENQLDDNVNFEGYQRNIYDYLQHSDLMIVPSISEGFGLIFLEAMNAKIPIIGFDVAATNEIIEHEKTGLLIPPFDTNQLANSIIELLNDKERSEKYVMAAYERLLTYFSLDRMTNATLEFYRVSLAEFSNKNKVKQNQK